MVEHLRYKRLKKHLNPKGIWNLRQNKPSRIVRDLVEWGVPEDVAYDILLGRGVFKWFAVRRDLIRLKDTWRGRVRQSLQLAKHWATQPTTPETARKRAYWNGYRKALEECRAEVRELCHSDRWQAPDNDPAALAHLVDLELRHFLDTGNTNSLRNVVLTIGTPDEEVDEAEAV